MNTHITQLDDTALISKTKSLATEERRLVNEVLHHLREIDRRRLYAARGYDSLFSFTVKELGYSDASAARRIGAMRLMAGLPAAASQDIEKSLSTGELNLSHLSKVQGFLRTERKEKKRVYTVAEKTQLIASLKSKSTRDAERVLASVSPESMRRKDVARPLNETETLVQFTADEALMAKLARVREVLSHRLPDASIAALLHQMGDLVLKAVDPLCPTKAAKKTIVPECSPAQERLLWSARTPPPERSPNPRYIPAPIKTAVFQKSGGYCEYVDPQTKRRCESRSYLQIDHITPVAIGGQATLQNLRVLCASHNDYEARRLGLVIA